MYLDHEKKIVYIHIPKNAGCLIKKHMKAEQVSIYAHDSIRELPENYQDYYKFATIRNPFTWYVSLYHYLQKYSNELSRWIDHENNFGNFLNNCVNAKVRSKNHEHVHEPEKPTSKLYSFIRNHDIIDCGWLTCQFVYGCFLDWEDIIKGQIDLTKNYEKLLSIDIVIKIEHLSELKKLTINKDMKINCSNHLNYREYYNEEMMKMVYKQDSLIFKLFNYKF